MRYLDFNDYAFIEVAKSPDVGVFAAPGAEFHCHIFVFVALPASLCKVAGFLLTPIIVPFLTVEPSCAFKAELVVKRIGF